MKLLKHITLERVIFVVLLIAALILLKRCGNDRDTYRAHIALADSLRTAAEQDRKAAATQAWEYQNNAAAAQYEARQQAKKADSIQRITRNLNAEIRALYRELGAPWPVDTVKIGTECCAKAVELVEENESLRLVDSLKDGAYLAQIDLATVRIDTLQNHLDRSDRRFWVMDSLNRVVMRQGKPRGSVWVGAGGMIGPVSGAGVYVKYQGARKEYTVGAGRQPGGWYVEIKVGTKISFRKR